MTEKTAPVTLVAIQMKVQVEDYNSPESFQSAVERCMKAASSHFGNGPNLVAFPEDVGLGILLMGHSEKLRRCKTYREAAEAIAADSAQEVMFVRNRYHCSLARAFCITRGKLVKQIYFDVFSKAAKKYHVTLIAGSAPIPRPNGTVYNTTYLFGPDGKLLGEQRKVHLVDLEMESGLDLTPGKLDEIHMFETPAGRVGVAICYDAFFEDVITRLVSQKTEILVQPSFNPNPWTAEQKSDWKTGTWADIHSNHSMVVGINPMMVGSLLDLRPEGQSSIISRDSSAQDGYLSLAKSFDQEEILSVTIPSQLLQ